MEASNALISIVKEIEELRKKGQSIKIIDRKKKRIQLNVTEHHPFLLAEDVHLFGEIKHTLAVIPEEIEA